MTEYKDLSDNLTKLLFRSINSGIMQENGSILFVEKQVGKIEGKIKVSIFSREREEPHFRLDFQGKSCRYKLLTCEPIDKVPPEIDKYKRNIKDWYKKNRNEIIKAYNDNLPDDAPPQARVHI